jgi:hypothetical protein
MAGIGPYCFAASAVMSRWKSRNRMYLSTAGGWEPLNVWKIARWPAALA